MKITINLPDNIQYWYKPVVWFIDPKDTNWTLSDLMQSICEELQLNQNNYSITGTIGDGEVVSVTRNN